MKEFIIQSLAKTSERLHKCDFHLIVLIHRFGVLSEILNRPVALAKANKLKEIVRQIGSRSLLVNPLIVIDKADLRAAKGSLEVCYTALLTQEKKE